VNANIIYAPRRTPGSEHHRVRGLEYHVTRWDAAVGAEGPPLVLLHGWMDTGATFQFLVDELPATWSCAAPDWRGFGRTSWAPGGYWFPDYYADLDRLLDILCPGEPATLVGHSMGGNVVLTYAGLRPRRVRRVVCIEGFGLARTQPEQAPGRLRRWLDELREEPELARFPSLGAVAAYLQRKNSRLDAARAHFVASAWARQNEDGTWQMQSDPAHKRVNPVLYRREESEACWRAIEAPVLYVAAVDSPQLAALGEDATVTRMSSLIRTLEPCTIAAAGHMIHHDQPAALALQIAEFLRRT
jgi:pimeloyl-ACP methyl ester carboxylesterase